MYRLRNVESDSHHDPGTSTLANPLIWFLVNAVDYAGLSVNLPGAGPPLRWHSTARPSVEDFSRASPARRRWTAVSVVGAQSQLPVTGLQSPLGITGARGANSGLTPLRQSGMVPPVSAEVIAIAGVGVALLAVLVPVVVTQGAPAGPAPGRAAQRYGCAGRFLAPGDRHATWRRRRGARDLHALSDSCGPRGR